MKKKVYVLPASWASVLINNDHSDSFASAEVNTWLSKRPRLTKQAVDCNESYVSRFEGLITDVCEYVFM